MKAPDWLLAHLIRAGYLTETGLGRRARLTRCTTCRAPVMSGLDGDVCALEAWCDPRPLTPAGEAAACVDGRRTWSLTKARAGRFELDPRDAREIRRHPAGTERRRDVLAEHRCHAELPTTFGEPYGSTSFAEITQPLPPGSPAPF